MAQEIGNSNLLEVWATSGQVVEPDISKIEEGWQLGEQPPHEFMNWLQNTFGAKLNHILSNGASEWNSTTSFTAGSLAKRTGNVWIAMQPNSNSEPADGNVNWSRLLKLADIVDDLVSTDTDKALSANQGKILNELGAISNYATSAVDVTVATPTGRNISVLDYTGATGTITLPASASMTIGCRLLIKKRNATMGSVNINKAGTDAVQWGSAQLRLYSDGDYWLLMWDGSRWCLLDGYETGSNAYGEWVKYTKDCILTRTTVQVVDINSTSGNVFSSPQIPARVFPFELTKLKSISTGLVVDNNLCWVATTTDGISNASWRRIYIVDSQSSTNVTVTLLETAIGEWY